MGAAADDEQLKILQEDQFDDEKYGKQIGLTETKSRIKQLDRRIDRVWGDRPRDSGGPPGSKGGRKHPPNLDLLMLPVVAPGGGGDSSSTGGMMNDSSEPRQPRGARNRESTELREKVDIQAQADKQRAKDELRRRIRREREQLTDEWREHQERDEKDIKRLPDDCISRTVKRSLKKMRQNLFQRRINLAIQERLTNDWTLPKIQAEVKKDRILAERRARQKTGKDVRKVVPDPGEAPNE